MTQDDVRKLVSELPEVVESAHHSHPDFRVRRKIFATLWKEERANVRLSSAEAHALAATEPAVYTIVSDREPFGWVGIELARAKPDDVRELLESAWRLVAPEELTG